MKVLFKTVLSNQTFKRELDIQNDNLFKIGFHDVANLLRIPDRGINATGAVLRLILSMRQLDSPHQMLRIYLYLEHKDKSVVRSIDLNVTITKVYSRIKEIQIAFHNFLEEQFNAEEKETV